MTIVIARQKNGLDNHHSYFMNGEQISRARAADAAPSGSRAAGRACGVDGATQNALLYCFGDNDRTKHLPIQQYGLSEPEAHERLQRHAMTPVCRYRRRLS